MAQSSTWMRFKSTGFYNSCRDLIKSTWLETLAVSIGSFPPVVIMTYNTFWLDSLKNHVHCYKLLQPVPLSEKYNKLWNEVITDLKLPAKTVKLLEPFTVYGTEPFHAGSMDSIYGVIIGIPSNFQHERVEDINITNFKVDTEFVDWTRKDAQELLKSMICSHDAQKFAVAREVLAADSENIFFDVITYPLYAFPAFYVYENTVKKFELAKKPTYVRGALGGAITIAAVGLWLMHRNILAKIREEKVDRRMSSLDDSYKKGGLEYYDKILMRNKALRSLMGKNGTKYFTEFGEQKSWFGFMKPLVSDRMKFFEVQLSSAAKSVL